MSPEWKDTVDQIYCALDLKRRIVGIRLLKDEGAFHDAPGITFPGAINFCQMVASASKGHLLKVKDSNFLCRSGARVLGIDPSDPKNAHGENWARLGLYKTPELCAEIRSNLTYSAEPQYGLVVGPIECFEEIPDIIQIAANPYHCMRVIQGYAYHYGMPNQINMIGNQAICLECGARPYILKDMNISLLCIGTRHRAHWGDDEMAIGIPAEQFPQVVDGLMKTINLMENDGNKEMIRQKCKKQGIDFEPRFHYNYYLDC